MTMTLKKLSEKYLRYNEASKDTKLGYQRILNRYWIPNFGNKQIHIMDCIMLVGLTLT